MLYKDVIQGDLWFGDGKLGTLMLIIFAQSIVASFFLFLNSLTCRFASILSRFNSLASF